MTNIQEPGWYSDPEGSGGERWWDGKKWGKSAFPILDAPKSEEAGEAKPLESNSVGAQNVKVKKDAAEIPASEALSRKQKKPRKDRSNKEGKKNIAFIVGASLLLILVLGVMAAAVIMGSATEEETPDPAPESSSAPAENTPAPSVSPSSTSTEEASKAYPAYVKTNFMANCEPGANGKKSVCECIYTELETTLAFEDFVELDSISSREKQTWTPQEKSSVEKLKTITNDCVLKYYNTES